MSMIQIISLVLCGCLILFLITGGITSFFEKETRAGIILISLAMIIGILLYIIIKLLPSGQSVMVLFSGIILLVFLLLIIPIPGIAKYRSAHPDNRFHEADSVLSRRRLQPGSSDYESYYAGHPEFRNHDEKARNMPGLLSLNSKYYDAGTFSAANANFFLTELLHQHAEIPPLAKSMPVGSKKSTEFIKQWLLSTGAHAVGFTSLQDYHLYSHKGRGESFGQKIVRDMPYAIAIAVEMTHSMMKAAPAGTAVMESSEQYLNSAILATKLTGFIKNLGYNALAHIDGHYEVICPLVAADAGLGVIGRMGLLITPHLGPRVRLAVVTTDIPLEYDSPKPDLSVLDFCGQCQKCAVVCPVEAIPLDERKLLNDGSLRWRINSEKCYLYWTIAGTDCGRCVISCPYAHSDNWFHRFFRWGIKNNLFFRKIAVKLDDIFYGRKPEIKRVPNWATIK